MPTGSRGRTGKSAISCLDLVGKRRLTLGTRIRQLRHENVTDDRGERTPGVGTSRMCERHPVKCFPFGRSLARSFVRPPARLLPRSLGGSLIRSSACVLACTLSIALKRAGAAGGSLSTLGCWKPSGHLSATGKCRSNSRARANE